MATERRIGASSIRLVEGDITAVPSDAIVNAANSALAAGSGVNGAINRAGGPSIMAELRARYRGCPVGSAVVSGSGNLQGATGARWVIHAVGPAWNGGAEREEELLGSAYRSALGHADELGARVVTMPALSAGIFGYPVDAAADVAIRTVAATLPALAHPHEVVFVLFSEGVRRSFERALDAVEEEPPS